MAVVSTGLAVMVAAAGVGAARVGLREACGQDEGDGENGFHG